MEWMQLTIQIAAEIKILVRKEGQRIQLVNQLGTASSKEKVKPMRMEEELAAESDYHTSDDGDGPGPMNTTG